MGDVYDEKEWKKLTGRTIEEWNDLWHIALDSYCDKKHLQNYPVTCPKSKPDDGYRQCQVFGHGYSTHLWHASPVKPGTVPWWHRTLGDSKDTSKDEDDSNDPAVARAAARAEANGLPMASDTDAEATEADTDLGEPDLGEADEVAAEDADDDMDLEGMREERVNEDAMVDANKLVDALELEDKEIDLGMRNLGPQGKSDSL